MSADELAFLTLGLVLGIAVGAALVEVLRARPRRAGEVRITMARDAVPARPSTLAGAVAPSGIGPAATGPGERGTGPGRVLDDEIEAGVPGPPERREAPPHESVDVVAVPVPARTEPAGWADAAGGSPIEPYSDRTAVPSRRRFGPETPVGIPIHPSPDPTLAAINVLVASGTPAARRTAVATRAEPDPDGAALDSPRRVRALSAVLRRDQEAIAAVATSVARGPEEAARIGALLGDLADVVATCAADAGAVDPVGHGFWHEFDVPEARSVVEALAALGFRFDLRDGFVDGMIPAQRDLSLAVAYAGLDPRRLRRWPGERELGVLFRGASVASERFVLASAPHLERHQLETLLAPHAAMLAPLFAVWDRVAPALLAEV